MREVVERDGVGEGEGEGTAYCNELRLAKHNYVHFALS